MEKELKKGIVILLFSLVCLLLFHIRIYKTEIKLPKKEVNIERGIKHER